MQEDGPIDKDLSLREDENKVRLENILDELLLELDQDIGKFKIIFKNLPLDIYSKIDSLAYTYSDKKNEDIKRIAEKAKKVNRAFHNQFK